jgi:hypothetical protein
MCNTSRPFPSAAGSGRVRRAVSPLIFDASDRDHPGARRGRAGGRRAGVPGLLGQVVAVGIRALARCTAASRDPVRSAATGAVRRVRGDARARTGVVGAASARRGGGDRRGTASGRRRCRASPDRGQARAAAGHRSRLVASGQATCREPASVRDPLADRAGRRTRSGDADGQRPSRRGRRGRARRPRVGPAVRTGRGRPVGARGVADRRTALRSPAAAAVAGPSFLAVVPLGHDLIAIQLRTAAVGQAPLRRFTARRSTLTGA